MYELKTKPTDTDVQEVIAAIPSESKRADAQQLLEIFQAATGEKPVVWGTKQIGFGLYSYQYASGHKGTFYTTGFAVAKTHLTLYLYMEENMLRAFLTRLGKARAGKSCVYVNKLADIDTRVLSEMICAAQNFFVDASPQSST